MDDHEADTEDMADLDRDTHTAHGETTYTLPQDPLFTRLLTLASHPAIRNKPAITDVNNNIQKTLTELLSDAIHLRAVLGSKLSPQTLKDLENDAEVYIHLLAPGGYEFTVGILAILSLGAACSPLSTAQPASELLYYARKTRAVGLVTAASASSTGETVARSISQSSNEQQPTFFHVSVTSSLEPGRPLIQPSQIIIRNAGQRGRLQYLNPNGPGIVIFTSGTTGPPKAAVLSRACITDSAMSFAEQLGLTSSDTLLHLLPVHHATGIWVSFFPFLQSGSTIEFKPGNFDPAWTWNRWVSSSTSSPSTAHPQLTHFSGVPTIYMRMMRHYNETLTPHLQPSELETYQKAAQQFKVMMCGTSALPKPIDDFWTQIRHGRRIVQRYGSTELGVVFNMPFDAKLASEIPDGSVGHTSLGVDVKLSSEGEVLAKSFSMFTKYLHDESATRDAFDDEGYFKSGDVARFTTTTSPTSAESGSTRMEKHWFIIGRKSVDIIKSGGYKISALDVEREIVALPYVAECTVVGVDDQEFGQRVACLLCLRDTTTTAQRTEEKQTPVLTLDRLRDDLRVRLAAYKLPTLLRLVPGELPKGGTGKVVKKVLGPLYFPRDYLDDPDVQVWNRRNSDRGGNGGAGKGAGGLKSKL